MMPAYDSLARHYDAVTGDPAAEAAFIHGIIERRHSQATSLLDVACGTGAVTALLSGAYQVSGLDISPDMLAVAREKLPGETPLYLADMTSFRLNVTFDVILCAYQGINHLLSFPAWEKCFDRVYDHLHQGGIFVFDVATVGHLRRMASIPCVVEQFADNYLVIRVRTADEMVFDWQIEVYELQPDSRYRLFTQTVKLRSFPLAAIQDALSARFTGIEILRDGGNCADEESTDRVWFACTKPA
jgi:SAM-dependent methyltransferase